MRSHPLAQRGRASLAYRVSTLLSWLAGMTLLASVGTTGSADAGVPASVLAEGERRLVTYFAARGVAYPPRTVALVALKAEARMELWVDGGNGWRFVRSYLVRTSSGRLGPKLREGDRQVPEGVYRVNALNPGSRYHLSMRIDYPNAFDRARAIDDGRTSLGGDIMIHGRSVSEGCLPVGDVAVEELFALAARVGTGNVEVIISPLDLRRVDTGVAAARAAERPPWLPELYQGIARALADFGPPEARDELPALAGRRVRAARPRCRAYDGTDCVRRCRKGDGASCAHAGLMYAHGLGVTADATSAWTFLRKACAGGDALGCGELGQLHLTDDGLRRDATRAAELARIACDAGDGHGCYSLARLCADRVIYPGGGDQCGPDHTRRLREQAVALLQKDCRGWGAYDCSTLAAIYAAGEPETALRFAAGSCEAGDPGGCDALGRLYEDAGDGARARALYGQACRTGYARACEPDASGAGGIATAYR